MRKFNRRISEVRKKTASWTHWSVEHSWDEIVPDTLHLVLGLIGLINLVRLSQDGAFWVNTNNLHTTHSFINNKSLSRESFYLILSMYGLSVKVIKLASRPWNKMRNIWHLTLTLGHLSFSLRAIPVIVPPVPAPATSMSILPVRREWVKSQQSKKTCPRIIFDISWEWQGH